MMSSNCRRNTKGGCFTSPYKKRRVEQTPITKRSKYQTEEERKEGIKMKHKRYYQKYKVIAQRKQRMRYAKKKLLASGIVLAGR